MPAEWDTCLTKSSTSILRSSPWASSIRGCFPNKSVNWEYDVGAHPAVRDGPYSVLNLFAYTGGATVACAKAGAEVTHVDAARGMVERAGENARLSGIASGIRYIVDDCKKFVQREIRRGNRYDAVIMDPPSYGRGPGGEMWKIESESVSLRQDCAVRYCRTIRSFSSSTVIPRVCSPWCSKIF